MNIQKASMSTLEEKRDKLVELRKLSQTTADAVDEIFDIKMVYTSNAIEGNPLSSKETAKIINTGLAIGDKPLKFNNEAADLYRAVKKVRQLSATDEPIRESTIVDLHRVVLWASNPELAGVYSVNGRRINGRDSEGRLVPVVFPNREKARSKLNEFYGWLDDQGRMGAQNTPATAFKTHRSLIAIHPFEDGNGRTSRLFMNLLLLRGGYSPVIVEPAQRDEYLSAMQAAVVDKNYKPHDQFMEKCLHHSLDLSIGKFEQSTHNLDAPKPKSGFKPGR